MNRKTKAKLGAISRYLVLALMLDAAIVFVFQTQKWNAWALICLYWLILTAKNLVDLMAACRMKRIPVQLDEYAIKPKRAHGDDAGLDLFCPNNVSCILPKGDRVTIDTGVHVQIPQGYAGVLKSKSGLMRLQGVTTDGLIDSGYSGTICVTITNATEDIVYIRPGMKITQLVILAVETPQPEVVDEVEAGERGNNGFGSSGV